MSNSNNRGSGAWAGKVEPTIWVDYTTGHGVNSDGSPVRPRVGQGRKNPNLTDMLDTALSMGAKVIRFTGKIPEGESGMTRHWLFASTPGWDGGKILPSKPASGTFRHIGSGEEVEVRTAAEWFDDLPLTPAQARSAWDTLAVIVRERIDQKATLWRAPSMTGANIWKLSRPDNLNAGTVSPETAEALHANSNQHHIDHLVAGESFTEHPDCLPLVDPKRTPKITRFSYVDGRFMYAALGRELGVGPGRWLSREAAYMLIEDEPYTRAWYHIRFRVPEDWNHIGLLGVQHPNSSDGWYFPNRPGATGETWADAAEVAIAKRYGWMVDPIEGIEFTKARPLDTYAERIIRAREHVEQNQDMPPMLRRAVVRALRSILIQSIGMFASRGANSGVRRTTNPLDIPAEYQGSVRRWGDVYTYRVPETRERSPFMQDLYRPELAVQVWGRGRARLLSAPVARNSGHESGGVLAVPAHTLLGVNGDALYTTDTPAWSVPTQRGGGDDGATGRLRLQGVAIGTFQTPANAAARDRLKRRAEQAGPRPAWEQS